jgi:hypothetical protein
MEVLFEVQCSAAEWKLKGSHSVHKRLLVICQQ